MAGIRESGAKSTLVTAWRRWTELAINWRGSRWRRFGRALFAVNWVLALAWTIFLLLRSGGSFRVYDFPVYRQDALNALQHGWAAYYGSGTLNVNPPLQGLLIFPFLPFSPQVGFALWTLFSFLCFFYAWWLLSLRRWWQFPLLLLLFPVVYTLVIGQVVLVIILVVTLAWWLSEHDRPLAAGFILSLATLKPQLIFLLPLALLVAGRRKEFIGFALGCLVIGAISLYLVGFDGVSQMLVNQHYAQAYPQAFSILPLMVPALWLPSPFGLILAGGLALLALAVAYRVRLVSNSAIYALGLLGSMLATPFLHIQDLALWIPVALLLQRSSGLPSGLGALGLFSSWLPTFLVPVVSLGGLFTILRSDNLQSYRFSPLPTTKV